MQLSWLYVELRHLTPVLYSELSEPGMISPEDLRLADIETAMDQMKRRLDDPVETTVINQGAPAVYDRGLENVYRDIYTSVLGTCQEAAESVQWYRRAGRLVYGRRR